MRFGAARLYRKPTRYIVEILDAPVEAETEDGRALLHFGNADDELVYFLDSTSPSHDESPVFAWTPDLGLEQIASGFEEWLLNVCTVARQTYTPDEWVAIERGPLPFTDRESEIVVARRLFRWRITGVTDSGNLRFEVHNGSKIVLPFLTVLVRGPVRGQEKILEGRAWLPTATLLPGQTAIIEKDCYKNYIDPNIVEVSDASDPKPEDRDRYWEFK